MSAPYTFELKNTGDVELLVSLAGQGDCAVPPGKSIRMQSSMPIALHRSTSYIEVRANALDRLQAVEHDVEG